ncbi:hypothetical protein [Azospirillum sp. TSO35-2]|uniref:hypothetical protein n=1 Tax=Azospirillum sp. TSO35-2 TaxID=716796 RepID=UPI000D621742|nr:hypothetical protein [Azospirillum sp. TSO35-2]PWC39028.1 hypothetical protein TSO352_01945 [Azospirillum sp. TSO35-2]
MPQGTLDRETLEAVGVLARAVERERVPGVLECRLLVNALRRTLDSGRERELTEASRVFRTLDAELRERIVARARVEAQAQARSHALRPDAVTVEVPPVTARRPQQAKGSAGSNFLAALNGLRPAASGKSSRGAAKDRLRAAVDNQRKLDERLEPTLD